MEARLLVGDPTMDVVKAWMEDFQTGEADHGHQERTRESNYHTFSISSIMSNNDES